MNLAPDVEPNVPPVISYRINIGADAEEVFLSAVEKYSRSNHYSFWLTRGIPPGTPTNRFIVVGNGMQAIGYNPFDYHEYSLSFHRNRGQKVSDLAVKEFADEMIGQIRTIPGVTTEAPPP